ncbi:hypothetical protein Vadar_031779 [Vaccinium darrowii]|uniref:Uncharacterized protein n=1 Tax=Vaccinium darrowii TaxID=229202 RepID=A0ACB7XE12_9ERIC|nr:hypothetical protein Vadar_031779 [Vaccinium darrowii]
MKQRVKPLFGMLLLVVLAVTLSCRVAIRGCLNSFQFQRVNIYDMSEATLNETMLRLAAVDLGEVEWKQEIEQLMEGNFVNQGRKNTFLSSGRIATLRDIRLRSLKGIPVNIQSPLFYPLWLKFRKNLQGWWRNMRFEPDIMSDLVNLVRVPIDQHNNSGGENTAKKRYSSCAVVGNSGILLQSENGELIDSHEMVIRLNNARTSGYERHVGSKTTLSFINSNMFHSCAGRDGCVCRTYGAAADVPVVMYICQPIHFLDYSICNSTHGAPPVITDARFDLLCTRLVKFYSLKRFVKQVKKPLEKWGPGHDVFFHYSSGMQAVMLAVGICDKVSVFGFGKSALAKHHYHTNQKAELGLHDYEAEYDLYHDLIDRPQEIPFISDKFKFPPVVIYQ